MEREGLGLELFSFFVLSRYLFLFSFFSILTATEVLSMNFLTINLPEASAFKFISFQK